MMGLQFPDKNIILIITTFIFSLIFLSGCATLGKDECLNADWLTIGYEDGSKGHPASRIGSHRKDCAKHGISPDFNRYEQGRLEGLREYCTPQKGYIWGTSGKQYTNVCPPHLEAAFLEGYHQGKIVYDAQIEVKKQKAALAKMNNELRSVEKKLRSYEAELINEDIGPQRRKKLIKEIKVLTEQRLNILNRITEQKALTEASQHNLEETTAQNPY